MADPARPSLRRRLLVVGIDLVAVLVLIPLVTMIPVTFGAAYLIGLANRDCAQPCDGLALIGISIWFLLVMILWVAYWPIFAFWRRRTIGSRLLGLRYAGAGLRRHLSTAATPTSQTDTPGSE